MNHKKKHTTYNRNKKRFVSKQVLKPTIVNKFTPRSLVYANIIVFTLLGLGFYLYHLSSIDITAFHIKVLFYDSAAKHPNQPISTAGIWSEVGGFKGDQLLSDFAHWQYSFNNLQKTFFIPADYSAEKNQFIDDIITTGSSSWDNYIFSARISPVDINPVGIVFRYQNQSNFYKCILSKTINKNTYTVALYKIVNGKSTQIQSKKFTIASDTDYINVWKLMTAKSVGNDISIYIDHTLVLSTQDSSFSKGKIGLYTLPQTSARFDDIEVYQV